MFGLEDLAGSGREMERRAAQPGRESARSGSIRNNLREGRGVQVFVLQHVAPAFAQIGQFRFISSVILPRVAVMKPLHPSQ